MIGFEETKVLSWNVRGALNENSRRVLKDIIRNKKPEKVILMETRCQFARVRRFWESLDFTPTFISEARGFSGGIWVLNNTKVLLNFRLVDMHSQAITFEVWKDNLSWIFSAVYASPSPATREVLWHHLLDLRQRISLPWMLAGDMNEVLLPSDVRGGDFMATRAARFGQVLEDYRMVDLGIVGTTFTWFRKVNNRIILSKRLDRAMGDVEWRIAFPGAYVETLNRISSDHSPLLIHCGTSLYCLLGRS